MTRSGRRRRAAAFLGLAVAAAAGAAWAGPITSARADGLLSYEITTAGRAVQAFQDDGTGARSAELDIPESTADLRAGPIGHAFASIVWPGATAGNLGTLLRVLQPTLPSSVTALNDPVRAEAITGQDPPTSAFSLPDVAMTATASDQLVEARATVGTVTGGSGPTSGFSSFGSARLHNTKPFGTATASVSGLSIAGGLVRIGAVTSTATATSDGIKGSGQASTEVAGLTIGGIGVSVDDRGLHIGSAGVPVNQLINQIVRSALASAGIEVAVGVPIKTINGASATMVAPALVVTIKSSSGVLGLVLGGARASVSAVADTSASPPPTSSAASASPPSFGGVSSPSGLPLPAAPSSPAPVQGSTPRPPTSAGQLETAPPLAPIAFGGHRLRGGSVALALLATALLAVGFGQLFIKTIGGGGDVCEHGPVGS